MRKTMRLAVAALAVFLLFAACAGEPEPAPEEPREPEPSAQPAPDEEAQPESEPAPEPEPEPKPEPESEPQPEPVPEAEPKAQEEPAEEESAEEEPIEVSEEVYEQTFDEIEATIEELNTVISNRNFQKWKSYLTEEYIDRYSDREWLTEISERPILKRNNITLRSLRDYFEWVVVPSRQDARLDDLVFHGENEVDAIMNIGGNRVILYRLRKVEGQWKVDAA